MRKKRIVVAMSGGVDSSVAAALLLERGYGVTGITMNLFSLPKEVCLSEELRSCCGRRALEDAQGVAIHLGIPHYVVDFRREFEDAVIADFSREYGRGRTPNPCIKCNERIKFGLLLDRAKRLGAERLATGHHARIVRDAASGRVLLKKGRDGEKDQSYFLYRLSPSQLGRVLMPVGDFTKPEVREMARRWKLPVAERLESQETCFAPVGGYGSFLAGRAPEAFRPGPIVDKSGRILGRHKGIGQYTIGQRRGLGVSSSGPLYVISIDARQNAIVVGPESDLYCRSLEASSLRLIGLKSLEGPITVRAKIRYKHEPSRAVVKPLSRGRVAVEFERPQRAITPGQSVVFYRRSVVLGGAVIERRTK